MTVKFYCDVYREYASGGTPFLTAYSCPPQGAPQDGMKRVVFLVDFPEEVLRETDYVAPVEGITVEHL